MTRSTPSRRSQLLSSPERAFAATFLYDNRNDELTHRDALAAAKVEHERVREAAIRVYELHELQQEHRRIVDEERKQEERLRAETLVVAEEKRLRELKAKTIPRPPPEPVQPPPTKAAPQTNTETSKTTADSKKPETVVTPPTTSQQSASVPAPQLNGIANQAKPGPANPFSNSAQPASQSNPFQKPASVATTPTVAISSAKSSLASPAVAQAPKASTPDRYSQIHKELKKLRSELQAQAKAPGSPLKAKMGQCRRNIRVSIGQLTSARGANLLPMQKIQTSLELALDSDVPSPPVDVNLYLLSRREPVEGATHNEATMPSLFIYLINICAKGIINQFITECGANPEAADHFGVFAVTLFSNPNFHWRGQSLIDILMAKFRIVCPVLFGFRGSEKTERGRVALGWKRDGQAWVTEQNHNDRMTGLGAGYASMSLRDFSRSTKANPYPPSNYWKALAGIVNSPVNEISNTQYIVLRSMIEGHEARILNFYGNAALAALRLALIDFPQKAPETATAAGSLRALAELLRTEQGLVLA
ncbi:hypothetical protein G7046_g9036 [Stylonectria norvegica]|nr:hypothetical protein G7046_g9036 [Stylonectria norvegica]